MKHLSLFNLIEKLKSSPRVKGIFTVGSTAKKMNASSDIDLVIILDNNLEGIKSVYTMIENRFADIFFFDIKFLNNLKNKQKVSDNNFEGIFLSWLDNGKIEYDPDNILLILKTKIKKRPPKQIIQDSEKKDFWIKINYNFIANLRYYNSKDKLYHQALEFRLLYSSIELLSAYFAFRDIPWRGEKAAVKYLKQKDPNFLLLFKKYFQSSSLDKKMKYYQKLFQKVFFGKYQKWPKDFIISVSHQNKDNKKLINFWKKLIS